MGNYTPESFAKKLRDISKKYPQHLRIALKKATEEVRKEAVTKHFGAVTSEETGVNAKNAMLKNGGGAAKRGRKSNTNLRATIHSSVDVGTKVSATVGSPAEYARIHEHGGMAGRGRKVRIPARPYLKPSLEAKREKITQLIADELIRVFN